MTKKGFPGSVTLGKYPRQDVDTIVLPAHEDGFRKVFLSQNCWWPVGKIQKEIARRLRYIAIYRTAPVSAITHYAVITSIESLPNRESLMIKFTSPKEIGPWRYSPGGYEKPVQGRRYANFKKLLKAKTLDDAF